MIHSVIINSDDDDCHDKKPKPKTKQKKKKAIAVKTVRPHGGLLIFWGFFFGLLV